MASRDFRKAVGLDSKLSIAHSNWASASFAAGDFKLACALGSSIACDTLRRSEGTELKKAIAREDKAIEISEAVAPKPLLDRAHIIRPGENLFRIGIRYGVSWTTLVKYNGLPDPDAVRVSQEIRIPLPESTEGAQNSKKEEGTIQTRLNLRTPD